jgi:nucleotide-binding universal stress UspA family protein
MAAVRRTRRATARKASGSQALRRLVVATLGDDDSAGALHLAAQLAKRDKATVLALGVNSPLPRRAVTVLMPSLLAADEEGRKELLEAIRERVNAIPGGDRWTKRAVIGMPEVTIARTAEDANAALLLLGLSHRGRLDRLFRGETAIAVMRQARVPTLAVPPNVKDLPRRAVAAIDFSAASMAAAKLAARLLARDGTLTLAHVRAFEGVDAKEGDLVDFYRAGADAKLDEAARALRRETRRRIDTVTLGGPPGEAILDHARRARSDLIALGGDEKGLMDRILLGSVRTTVVRGAKCSVLIAPAPAQAQDRSNGTRNPESA